MVADSTSRWAEALREFASRNGELPAEEGYPAGLASALAAFYERAGRVVTLGGWEGSVTIIGAVSPPGGDMTEPVTAYTQRFVRCLWTLDRDLAYARHYPAVSWSGSFSRDAAVVAAWHAAQRRPWLGRPAGPAGRLLAEADRLGALAELMGVTALPPRERVAILGRAAGPGGRPAAERAERRPTPTATTPGRPRWSTRCWRSPTGARSWPRGGLRRDDRGAGFLARPASPGGRAGRRRTRSLASRDAGMLDAPGGAEPASRTEAAR